MNFLTNQLPNPKRRVIKELQPMVQLDWWTNSEEMELFEEIKYNWTSHLYSHWPFVAIALPFLERNVSPMVDQLFSKVRNIVMHQYQKQRK